MSVIQFTRLDRQTHVWRRYGDFTFTADKKIVTLNGYHQIEAQETGEQEIEILQKQFRGIWDDHVALAGGEDKPTGQLEQQLKGGQQSKASVGNVAGYLVADKSLTIRITNKKTEIEARNFQICSREHVEHIITVLGRMYDDRRHARKPYVAPPAT